MLPTGSLIEKDPQASSWPKGIDWTDYLAELDSLETIVTSTWAVTGPDALLLASSPLIVTGNKKTLINLAGGTAGSRYTVTNSIITSSGVQDDRSFDVIIENL